jgi:hypothetical protein
MTAEIQDETTQDNSPEIWSLPVATLNKMVSIIARLPYEQVAELLEEVKREVRKND